MKRSTLYALMTLTVTSTGTFNVPVVSAKEREKEQYENYIKTFGNNVFGHWRFQTKVYEHPSNEVLPIIDAKHFKTTVTEYITEVDNIIPSAKYEISLKEDGKTKVDLVYLNGCNKTNASTWEQYKKDLELLLGAPQNNLDIKTYNIRAYAGKIENKDRYIYITILLAQAHTPI